MKRKLLCNLGSLFIAGFFLINSAKAQSELIPTGSFIVNMGVMPQTYGNGIKPWGMVYDLLQNYKVQVKWVISQTKLKDGIDFNYNGVDYMGGTFIIPAIFRTAAVNSRITYWQGQGVVGTTTTSDFSANVTYTLKYTPRWTFDFKNGDIGLNYLDLAGIPSAQYPKKEPWDLDGCDDLFVMPHADPTWDTHKNLLYWNLKTKGWIWYGCHAGSVVENLYSADSTERMNFLSANGLVPDRDHQNATPPYEYLNPNDPEMQFMGKVDDACQNGAEQVYLPKGNFGWRPTTKASVYDPTQEDIPTLSTGPAGIIVYGRGFGDNNRGKVMMQAGHNYDKGGPDAVAGIRAFFNFSFLSVYEKIVEPEIFPQMVNMTSGQQVTFAVRFPPGVDSRLWTCRWTSPCGTFSDPFKPTTTFVASAVATCTPCEVIVEVYDNCGRTYYQKITITVCPLPPVAQDIITNMIVNNPGTPAQMICKDFPLAGTDADGYIVNYIIKTLPTSGVLSYDHDGNTATPDLNITSLPTDGLVLTKAQSMTIKYDPVDGFSDNATFMYTVTDNTGLLDLTPAMYTIPVDPPPVCKTFICIPASSNTSIYNVCPMEATDEGTVVSYTIVTLPPASMGIVTLLGVEVEPGQVLTPMQIALLKFKPGGSYVGYAEITYTATDEKGVSDQTPATLTLQLVNQPPVATDISANTIANPVGTNQYGIPQLKATDIDGTIVSYNVTNIPAPEMGVLYLNGIAVTNDQLITLGQIGNLKFDPKDNFSGIAKFYFTATDNDGLVDNTPATYSIPVKHIVPVVSNVTNANINAAAAQTTISPLVASDPDSTNIITKFIITRLPDNVQGTLFYNNAGVYTAAAPNQQLTPAQATTLKFDPNPWIGTATFNYTAMDDEGFTDPTPATFSIPIVNSKPTAINVTSTPIKDTTATAILSPGLNGNDIDGTITAYIITSLPAANRGVLKLNNIPVMLGAMISAAEAQRLQFSPVLRNDDNASFKFASVDNLNTPAGRDATYTIKIDLVPYKIAPVATNVKSDSTNMLPMPVAVRPFTATDADGYITSYKIKTIPSASQGTLYVRGVPAYDDQIIPEDAAPDMFYIPSGTFKGMLKIKYEAIDDDGNKSNEAYVEIHVVNAAPVSDNVTIKSVKKGSTVRIPSMSATDIDGTISSFKVLSLPVHGTLQYDSAGTNQFINVTVNKVITPGQAGRFRIKASNTIETVNFTFSAKDNANDTSAVGKYSIPVTSITENQSPSAKDFTAAPINMSNVSVAISPLTATDVDGTIVYYTIKTLPPAYYGTLLYNSTASIFVPVPYNNFKITNVQATSLRFQPSGVYSGNVPIQFSAIDNDGAESTPAILTIPITNQPPVATNITNAAILSSDGPKLLSPLAATDDGSIKTYIITSIPTAAEGVLLMDGIAIKPTQYIPSMYANRIEFDPRPSFSGNATFQFTAIDNTNQSDASPATFTIPVNNVKPMVNDILSQVITNQPGTGALLIPSLTGNDNDGTISNYFIQSLPVGGKLYKNGTLISSIPAGGYVVAPNHAGLLSFNPDENYGGTSSFIYTAKDNSSNSSMNTAIYQIPVNEAPITSNISIIPIASISPKKAIAGLIGSDDVALQFFTITALPTAAEGTLFVNNVAITSLDQVDTLTAVQANQLSFQPTMLFDGVIFTYTATDNMGVIDVTPAVYRIPMMENIALPVKLLSFSGTKTGMDNVLNWSTSEETNSDRFELERSNDGTRFEKITTVNAKGNTTSRTGYTFTDKNVSGTTQYYRLKMIDMDSKSEYSRVVVIKRDKIGINISSVAPNPFVNKISVDVTSEIKGPAQLQLFDLSGKLVRSTEVKTVKGTNHFDLDKLESICSGIYILSLRSSDGVANIKLYKGK